MPRVPDVVEGIVNYRGEIFPLVNGRRLFGFERKDFGEDSSIVMVSCGDERFGLVVDRIPEVRALPYASMQEFPKRRGARIDQDLIRCLCQDGDRMVIVVDAEALLKKIDVTQPTN
jgi:purine-binding chemotaxis protein CheW